MGPGVKMDWNRSVIKADMLYSGLVLQCFCPGLDWRKSTIWHWTLSTKRTSLIKLELNLQSKLTDCSDNFRCLERV